MIAIAEWRLLRLQANFLAFIQKKDEEEEKERDERNWFENVSHFHFGGGMSKQTHIGAHRNPNIRTFKVEQGTREKRLTLMENWTK